MEIKKLKCPNCAASELDRVPTGQLEVDPCPKCEGVWFDSYGSELKQILDNGRDILPDSLKKSLTADAGKLEAAQSRERKCPRCRMGLLTYWYAGDIGNTFQVDGCMRGCGFWFDDGELGKAFEYLKRKAAPAHTGTTAQGIIGRVSLLRDARDRA